MTDPYTILGVPKNADVETIKRAFRAKAKILHPDVNKTGDREKFQLIQAAYDALMDPNKPKMIQGQHASQNAESAAQQSLHCVPGGFRIRVDRR